MNIGSRRSITKFVLVFFIFVLGIITYLNYTNKITGDFNSDSGVEIKKDSLSDVLTQQTNFGGNRLKGKEYRQFGKIVDRLDKDHYIGAYLGIKNNKIKLSGSAGYANLGTTTEFRINSPFLAGQYQEIINNAIILHYVSAGKIKLTDKVGKFVSNSGSITIKDLLQNRTQQYISLKQLKTLDGNKQDLFKNIQLVSKHSSDIAVEPVLKVVLVSRLSGKSYAYTIQSLIVSPMGLTNTRIYTSSADSQSNDVESYKYATTNRIPNQEKMIQLPDPLLGIDQLRMSISDIVISYTEMMNNQLFLKKYDSVFLDSVQAVSSKNKISSAKQYISFKTHNQTILMQYNSKEKNLLIVGSNYPNKKLTDSELFNSLEKILN